MENIINGFSRFFDEFEPLTFEDIENLEHWFVSASFVEKISDDLLN